MNERQNKLFELFKMAIDAEHTAKVMYTDMLAVSDDPEVSAIIEAFRLEEERHERILTNKYAEMRAAAAHSSQ